MYKNSNKLKTFRVICSYLSKNMLLLSLSLLLAIVSVISSLYLPILFGRAVDAIVGPNMVDFDVIFSVLVRGGIAILITMAAQWLMNLCNNRMTANIVCRMRRDALVTIEKLPISYIDAHPHGDLVSRVMSDVDTFSDGLLLGFTQLFSGIMTIVATMFFMLAIDVRIGLLVIVLTPISLFTASYIARRTYHMFRAQAEINGKQTAFVQENIENQKLVRAFAQEERQITLFGDMNEARKKASFQAVFYSSLTNPTTRFVNALVYASVAISGSLLILSGGAITIGQLTCFLTYANQYTKPFNEISGVIAEFQNALACAERVFAFIHAPVEHENATKSLSTTVRGDFTISDVFFSYDKNQKLIEHFSLDVKAGERIAIVGPTGCGKTTLINLLMRFYEPDSGRISLDGVDITALSREELRSRIGMVLQETWLKEGTIRENIVFGKENASDEEMILAAKRAHAHSFIRRLPQGYDTRITEDGGNLSPGQKQLLCIARVMLLDPEVLILDEATSSIDTRTELKIQDAFTKLTQGKTSFIVAHRLSTIRNADRILVMNAGNVVEQGTHVELIAKNGFYAKLYQSRIVSDRETDG